MIATNHALTGAVIGLSVSSPWIAIPAALISHFICDAIPHFGAAGEDNFLRSKSFRIYLVIDALLCILLVISLFVLRVDNWFLVSLCAFLAASPDFWHIKRFVYARNKQPYRPGKIAKFSSDIQWFQRPIGAIVEIAWGAGAIFLLANMI